MRTINFWQKPTSFSDATNQNGGIQIYPIWKKEGKNLTPCSSYVKFCADDEYEINFKNLEVLARF